MTKQELQELSAAMCGFLSEQGFEYHFEADNRSNRKSCYIYVRRPRYMEIRISDHPMRRRRAKTYDIGPHGITVVQAMAEIIAYEKDAHRK